MRLICPNCGAQYEVPEDTIPEAGRDVQCSNCSQTWFQKWEVLQSQSEQSPESVTRRPLDPEVEKILREEADREIALAKPEETPKEEVLPLPQQSLAENTPDGSVQSTTAGKSVAQQSYEQLFPSVAPRRISQIKRLVEATPVHLEEHDGRLGLANKGSPERVAPIEMANLIATLKSHVEQLLFECGQKQVPEDFKRRLENYLVPLSQDVPIFLMLDAPMAFVQGSLNDSYVTEALDGGFVEACRLLVRMHQQLRPLLISAERSEELVPDLSPEFDEQEAIKVTDAAIEALDDPSVEREVIEALKAAKDYFETAQQSGSIGPSLLRRGIAAVGGIVSGAMAGACGTALYVWATSPSGLAVIVRLQPILERLLALFS